MSCKKILVCPYLASYVYGNNIMGDTIGQSCHSNDSDFFDTLRNCLHLDPNGINEFFKDFNLPIGHQPTKVKILATNHSFNFNAAEVMTKIWHEKYGLCYILDGQKYWPR